MISQHTLEVLEFQKVITLIRGKCLTPFGKEEVDQIKPLYDWKVIKRRLSEVTELKDIINFGDPFPLVRLEDCRENLERSVIEDLFLDTKEIKPIFELIKSSIELNRYDKENRENFPNAGEYLDKIRSFPELLKEINRTFDENGDIKDNASPALKKIRFELTDTRQGIIKKLEKILSNQYKQQGWQDDVVTIRNDRYVIPVPSGQFKSDLGILHDRSQSGATLYVEPEETVASNNRINILLQEERLEIDRILRAITKEIGIRKDALVENCRLIGIIDSLHATAGFSNIINGNKLSINEKKASFDFKNIKHPLLITQLGSPEKVVPNSISLNKNRQVILVTGPNTGGKTISLKTIGLSLLMIQSGLHIAADETSEVGIFEHIFADIGDEQSIEQSLSTFSSHIKNITDGLSEASENTLLLYDEIGVGTDPKEGSALAESIILYALEKGAKMLVTTHYSQLKTLAMEYPQIENGSFEFDKKTLSPTYILRIGLPGSSYAVEIAGRMGMPNEVCKKATSLIDSGEKSVSALITSLEEELLQIKKDKQQLTERLNHAKELEEFYKVRADKIKKEADLELKKALSETDKFLEQTRKDIEHLVADIRKSQASKKSLKDFHEILKKSETEIKSRQQKLIVKPLDNSTFAKGDSVEIISLNQKGEIEQIIGKEKAQIRIGQIITTVEFRNLRKIDKSTPAKMQGVKTANFNIEDVESNQIHLRGMTADEAIEALERFLDRAVIVGFEQVYIVHGKGTGKLRNVLTKYLKTRTEVATLRLGDFNEGGAGVTIVKLKN